MTKMICKCVPADEGLGGVTGENTEEFYLKISSKDAELLEAAIVMPWDAVIFTSHIPIDIELVMEKSLRTLENIIKAGKAGKDKIRLHISDIEKINTAINGVRRLINQNQFDDMIDETPEKSIKILENFLSRERESVYF